MSVNEMKCSSCGAQLPIPPLGERFLRCRYCGTTVQLDAPPPLQVSSFGGGPPASSYGAPPVSHVGGMPRIIVVPPTAYSGMSGGRAVFMIVPVVMVLFSTGMSLFFSSRGSSSVSSTGVGSGGVAPLGEHLQWGSEAPIPARVNADDIEDFIGDYHLLEGDQQLTYIGAFNGKTLERVWAAGPFGNNAEASGKTFFGVAKDRVIVTDFRSTAHIFDMATGKETGKVVLSDRAKSVCTSTDGKPEAWLELADDEHLLVDLAAGTAKKSGRPAFCPIVPNDSSNCTSRGTKRPHATCHDDSSIKAPGVSIEKVLSDGDVAVALGTKSPGTAIPTALGVDVKAKKVKWQRPIPGSDPATVHEGLELADLAGGRLVAQYQLTGGLWRLAALDGRTGNALWDVEIPRSKDGSQAYDLRITPTRVYLPHWTWLDVFDVKTGAVIGTVGKW
jgi:hypothetical protein